MELFFDIFAIWAQIVDSYPPGLIEFSLRMMIEVIGYGGYGLMPYIFSRDEKQRIAIRKCGPQVILNMILGNAFYMFALYCLSRYRGSAMWDASFTRVDNMVPTVKETVITLLVANLIFDFSFYYIHRMMHWGLFYRLVHWKHHSFTEPVAISVSYVHPVEYILIVIGALVMSAALQGAHVLTTSIWGAYVVFVTTWLHTGNDIPWLANHDGHHLRKDRNFGAVGIMDWLHGTQISASEVEKIGRRRLKGS